MGNLSTASAIELGPLTASPRSNPTTESESNSQFPPGVVQSVVRIGFVKKCPPSTHPLLTTLYTTSINKRCKIYHRSASPGGPNLAAPEQLLADSGQFPANFGRIRPKIDRSSDQCWSIPKPMLVAVRAANSAEIGPKLVGVGPTFVVSGRIWPNSRQIRSIPDLSLSSLVEFGPVSIGIGPKVSAPFRPIDIGLADVGRCRPSLDRFGRKSAYFPSKLHGPRYGTLIAQRSADNPDPSIRV